MNEEVLAIQTVQLETIKSLDQSKEKWFELLKESLDDEELRISIMEKIDHLEDRIFEIHTTQSLLPFRRINEVDNRLEEVGVNLQKQIESLSDKCSKIE